MKKRPNSNNTFAFKQDCRHFLYDRPCKYHKINYAICDNCQYKENTETKILIIKLDALGDVLRTMSILPPLKKKYPRSLITWITRTNAIPLFDNVEFVDEVLDYTDPFTTHLLQTVNFDLVINPDANKAAALLASFARAEEKRGFIIGSSGKIIASNDKAYEWFLMGLNDEAKKRNTKTYQQIILDMLELDKNESYIPLQLNGDELKKSGEFCKKNKLSTKRPVIGLNLGAGGRWQNKVWPVKYFESLIGHMLKKKLQIVLLGGINEKQKMHRLKQKFGNKIVSGGYNNTLRDFFPILNVCDVLVSSDSMAAHAGLALGKNVVVFLGPTSINEFETYGRGIKLHADMDCLVCYRSVCEKKPSCMDSLHPEIVQDSILNFLQ